LLDFVEKLEREYSELGFCNKSLHEIFNDKSVRAKNFLIEQKNKERNRGEEETHQ